MLVSVAIPAYNQADYLREAIESVIGQTYRPLEIVVVNDGSTDHTAEVCLEYKEVNYIYQDNDGTKGGGARVRAIKEAKGEWVALLDQDDLWLPTKIEKQVKAIKNRPDLGAVFTQTKHIDGSGRELDRETIRGKSGWIFHDLLRGNLFYASSGIFRKSVLDICGYPDSDALADWDLWLRIARYWEVYIIDEYLTRYRIHDGCFSRETGEIIDRHLLSLARQQPRLHEHCAECKKSARFLKRTFLRYRAYHHLNSCRLNIVNRNGRAASRHLAEVFKSNSGILFQYRYFYRVVRGMLVRMFLKARESLKNKLTIRRKAHT